MPRNSAFWRNLSIVGLLHVGALFGLTHWSAKANRPLSTPLVWVDPATFAAPVSLHADSDPEPAPPVPEEMPSIPEEDQLSMPTPPPSEIEEPSATPTPTATPRPTPKATPKATTTPKKAIAKASSPKPPAPGSSAAKTKKVTVHPTEKSGAAPTGSSGQSASTRNANAAAVKAQLVTYGRLLHDRFYSEWSQPTGLPPGARYTLSVKVRIERDGRVSEFKLVRSSGNVVVDESVEEAGKRVTQVPPLPPELAGGGSYDLNVNFELDAE